MTLGSTSRVISRHGPAPAHRAAAMKSVQRITSSVALRATRANNGTVSSAIVPVMVLRPGPADQGQAERHDQRREGGGRVDEDDDGRVQPAADGARRHTDQSADEQPQGGRDQADHERDPAAVQHAGEQILAQPGGAEQVLPRRSGPSVAEVLPVGIEGQPRRGQRRQHHHGEPAGGGRGRGPRGLHRPPPWRRWVSQANGDVDTSVGQHGGERDDQHRSLVTR